MIIKLNRTSVGQFTGGLLAGARDSAFGGGLPNGDIVGGLGTDNTSVFKDFYISSDKGVTWVQQADFPGAARNEQGYANGNGRVYMWGGNSFTTIFKDSWSYDSINGWVQISSDMGSVYNSLRKQFAFCYTGTEFIVIGGNNQTNVIASPDLTTNSWVVRGTLPTEIQNMGGMTACYFQGAIYLTSGQSNTAPFPYPGNMYKSIDGGATWTIITNQSIFAEKWGNLVPTNDFMSYIEGNIVGPGNIKGCWWSIDGITWIRYLYEQPAKHATASFASADGTEAYTFCGNMYNDSWIIRRID